MGEGERKRDSGEVNTLLIWEVQGQFPGADVVLLLESQRCGLRRRADQILELILLLPRLPSPLAKLGQGEFHIFVVVAALPAHEEDDWLRLGT